jgi:hypothetical protein
MNSDEFSFFNDTSSFKFANSLLDITQNEQKALFLGEFLNYMSLDLATKMSTKYSYIGGLVILKVPKHLKPGTFELTVKTKSKLSMNGCQKV